MYQIKVNGILLSNLYFSFQEAMRACEAEKERFIAIITEIVHVD